MYSHAIDYKLRQYLKRKARLDKSKKETDFSQLPEVVEIFDVNKMNAMLKEHGQRDNLYRNHQRYINYLLMLRTEVNEGIEYCLLTGFM